MFRQPPIWFSHNTLTSVFRRNDSGEDKPRTANTFSLATPNYWLVWIAICLVYILIRLNTVSIPLDRDEGIFGYAGQVILNNGLPYRDVFDHKPPVAFYLNALALLFVPPTSTGIHTFLHVYNFLTLIVLFFLAKTYTESYTTGLWVAFTYAVFSSSPAIQGFTASTEMLLLLPMSMSLLCGVLAVQRRSILFSLVSGICGALAFFTKQTAGVILVFICLYVLASLISCVLRKNISRRTSVAIMLGWGAGFILVVLLFAGYYYYHKVFDEFLYWSFTHSLIYSKQISIWKTLPRIYSIGLQIVKGNFLIIAMGLAVSLFVCFRRNLKGCFMLGFLLFSFLATVPGTVYNHYFAQIAPAVSMAGGWAVALCLSMIPDRMLRRSAALLTAATIVAVPIWAHSGYYFRKSPIEFSRSFFGGNPFPESEDLAEFLAERTSKEDTIFIIGSEAQIFLLSQRQSSSSFALIYPLMSEYPRYQEFQRKAWEEVKSRRPKYIIIVRIPASLLWDGKADLWIVKKTRQLTDKAYLLEAVMTIAKPKGDLRVFSEGEQALRKSAQNRFPILIFRRTS
jgi:hypothetical protein